MAYFSVITPFFNAKKYIKNYLDHHIIKSEINTNEIEFIFIDDNSTDGSSELLKNLLADKIKYKIIKNSENKGPGYSRYKASKESKGNYLIFVDIDDKVDLKKKIEGQYKAMKEENKKWSFTQFSINRKKQLPNELEISHIKQITRERYIALSSIMIQKKLFMRFGHCMAENSYSSEDYSLWIKLVLEKIWPIYINNTIMIYNKSENGLSSDKLKQLCSVFKIYRNYFGYKRGIIEIWFFIIKKITKQ